MTHQEARAKAEAVLLEMQTMNASSEHPPSIAKAFLASTVLDLASQLAAYDDLAARRTDASKSAADGKAAKKSAKGAIVAPEPTSADGGASGA